MMRVGARGVTKQLVLLAWCLGLAASCGGGAGTGNASGASDAGGSGLSPDSGAPAGTMTDKDYCDRACATLIGCAVQYDATCSAGCLQAPAFLACVKTAPNECNALALCAFAQASAALCGGAAGVPRGNGSCGSAADCEYLCGSQNAGAACSCACWAGLAPAKAINLLINNQCATAACAVPCGPGGSGPACNACFVSGVCAAQNAQCTSR
jgi:hypothetical protein